MTDYEKQGARQRDWRAANPDKVRLQNERRRERDAGRINIQRRRWRAANPDKVRAGYKRRAARKRALRAIPDDATCEICNLKQNIVRDKLHNGLLCRRCHTGLVMMRGCPVRLSNAVAYITRHETDTRLPKGQATRLSDLDRATTAAALKLLMA
jgi:hypothetical protein